MIQGLDGEQYQLVSPVAGTSSSTLVVLSRADGSTRQRYQQLTAAGIDAAFREGNLRLSLHLFNTTEQIGRILGVMHAPPCSLRS